MFMKKFIPIYILMQFFALLAYSQRDSTDKYLLDSLLRHDEMIKLINEMGNDKSYIKANLSISNNSLSNQSKTLKYLQSDNSLMLNPSVGYFHKSGLGVSFNLYASQRKQGFGFFEAGIMPSYVVTLGAFDFMASYSHLFPFKKFEQINFMVQDEWNLSSTYNSGWVNPSITAGYSTGHINEIIKIDTSINANGQNIRIKYIDTVTTRIKLFQLVAALGHTFYFQNIFSDIDNIYFTPQVMIGAGLTQSDISHKSSTNYFNSFTKKRLKKRKHFLNSSDNSMFEIQTLALDLDATYTIKKFYIEPEVYLEYYLLKTEDKRLTPLLNITVGFIF